MRVFNSSMIVVLGIGILTGCDGGGDGGSSGNSGGSGDDNGPSVRAPGAINASNGQRIARDVVQGSETITTKNGATVFVASASERDKLPGLRALSYELALKTIAAGSSTDGFVNAQALTRDCLGGGTQAIDGSDKNGNLQPDAGDSATFTYTNCVLNGEVRNGTIAVNIIAREGDLFSKNADYAFSFDFLFDDLSLRQKDESLTLNGGYILADSYTAADTVDRVTTRGAELDFTDGMTAAQLRDFNFLEILNNATQQSTAQYDFIYDNREFAGSVTVVTNTPFRGLSNLPPESGTLTIRGADNTRAVVQATGGGTARISIDANGDGDFTDSGDRVINSQWTTLFG